MLILARMPLFFFVSGLFAWRVVTRTDFESFAREKVGNLVYLYLLWATLLFVTDLPRRLGVVGARDRSLGAGGAALGALRADVVLLRARHRLPRRVALPRPADRAGDGGGARAYVVAVATGDWMRSRSSRRSCGSSRGSGSGWCSGRRSSPCRAPLAAVAAAARGLSRASPTPSSTSWNRVGPLTFVITGVGIARAPDGLGAAVAAAAVAGPLAVVGASTLYIYATQHVTIFYLERAARFLEVPFELVTVPALVIVVAAGTVFGRWAAGTVRFAWLFRAPWLGRGAGAGRGTMAAA